MQCLSFPSSGASVLPHHTSFNSAPWTPGLITRRIIVRWIIKVISMSSGSVSTSVFWAVLSPQPFLCQYGIWVFRENGLGHFMNGLEQKRLKQIECMAPVPWLMSVLEAGTVELLCLGNFLLHVRHVFSCFHAWGGKDMPAREPNTIYLRQEFYYNSWMSLKH